MWSSPTLAEWRRMRRHLQDVTLIGVDCVDVHRLIRAAEISAADLEYDDVRLLSSSSADNAWVTSVPPLGDIEAYNDFILTQLHRYVATAHALVIQHDGFVLNADAWTDEFRQWDFIGAPWEVNGLRVVGNGGFSLRSRQLLQRLAEPDLARPPGVPEDWFVCVSARDVLEREGFRFAPPDLAHRFSFEGDPAFGVSWSGQFGFHGLTWTDISAWLNDHPDSGIVNDLDEESQKLLAREQNRKTVAGARVRTSHRTRLQRLTCPRRDRRQS